MKAASRRLMMWRDHDVYEHIKVNIRLVISVIWQSRAKGFPRHEKEIKVKALASQVSELQVICWNNIF